MKRLLLLSLAVLLLSPLAVSSSTHFIASPSTRFFTGNFYLSLGSDLYASSVSVKGGQSVSFVSASLGAGSVTQTFGFKVTSANTTLTVIASDHIEDSVSLKSAATSRVYFYYTMPPGSAFSVPQSVLYAQGLTHTTINQGSYFTSATLFGSCTAPCVFENPSNSTLVLKAPSTTSYTVDWYYSPSVPLVLTVAVGGAVAFFVFLLIMVKRKRRVPP